MQANQEDRNHKSDSFTASPRCGCANHGCGLGGRVLTSGRLGHIRQSLIISPIPSILGAGNCPTCMQLVSSGDANWAQGYPLYVIRRRPLYAQLQGAGSVFWEFSLGGLCVALSAPSMEEEMSTRYPRPRIRKTPMTTNRQHPGVARLHFFLREGSQDIAPGYRGCKSMPIFDALLGKC